MGSNRADVIDTRDRIVVHTAFRREFGLDDPLPVQYWNYLTGLLRGDWGRSILSRRPVLEDLSAGGSKA